MLGGAGSRIAMISPGSLGPDPAEIDRSII
jgi:hypothetical protein